MRILQIGTYPIQPRTHGGQRRVVAPSSTATVARESTPNIRLSTSPPVIPPATMCPGYRPGRRRWKVLPGGPALEDVILGDGLDEDSEALFAVRKSTGISPRCLCNSNNRFSGGRKASARELFSAADAVIYSSQTSSAA